MATKTEQTPANSPQRVRRECPHCGSNRFHREEMGHFDELTGEWVVDEVQYRCLGTHHVILERDLVSKVLAA